MTGAWRPSLLALCGVAIACGDGGRSREYPAPVPPAVPTTAPPGTEAMLAPKTLSSLPLGLSAEELCASLGQERSESNQVASDRLALLLSAARIEVTIGELVRNNEAASFAAALHVDHVWFGPWFLEGVDTSIVIPAAERERFEPGRYLLGMSQPFPPRNSSDGLGVWREVKAWIPIARSDDYEDLLGYAVPSSARAAVVEIVAVDQESHTAYLHVLEPLAGEVPEDFTADWDAKNRALKFPFAGPAPYVMTFSGFEVPRGRFSDFRPWDETAQAIVRQGLEAPLPVADAGELAAWAESYRAAWAFHVAPHVVETRVSGRGFDLGETVYLSHELRTDFKSNVGVSQLLFEGDGRQLENHSAGPQCGDSFLTALGDEAPLTSAPPELDGACSSLIALPDSEIDVTPADFNIHVQLPDSELGREQVAAWLAAPDPVYLLSDAPGPREPAALAANAFWSQTPSLEQTLAVAQLLPITVQSVTRQGALTHVTLQLSGGGAAPAPLRHLTASCIDPRLLREGSSWLAPVVSDPSGCCADEHSPSFIVPGWLFPRFERALRSGSNARALPSGLTYLVAQGIYLEATGIGQMAAAKTNPAFMTGVPEILILRLLTDREMYGYELVQAIEAATGAAIKLGEGVVYPVLHALEASGRLRSRRKPVNGRTRVYYSVTAAGKQRLASVASDWARITQAVSQVLEGAS